MQTDCRLNLIRLTEVRTRDPNGVWCHEYNFRIGVWMQRNSQEGKEILELLSFG